MRRKDVFSKMFVLRLLGNELVPSHYNANFWPARSDFLIML